MGWRGLITFGLITLSGGTATADALFLTEEFRSILEADQRDWGLHPQTGYSPGSISPSQSRDRERRQRIKNLLERGKAKSAGDYFAAAIIYQHGETVTDFTQAYELAIRATQMGWSHARPIAAVAWDRRQVYLGLPQRFGTQYRCDPRCHLEPFDPNVTDQMRREWGIAPIGERNQGWNSEVPR